MQSVGEADWPLVIGRFRMAPRSRSSRDQASLECIQSCSRAVLYSSIKVAALSRLLVEVRTCVLLLLPRIYLTLSLVSWPCSSNAWLLPHGLLTHQPRVWGPSARDGVRTTTPTDWRRSRATPVMLLLVNAIAVLNEFGFYPHNNRQLEHRNNILTTGSQLTSE